MVSKKEIELLTQIMEIRAELLVVSEKMRVLAYAMTNIHSDNGRDLAVMYSIVMDVLRPYLTVEDTL